MSLKQTIKSALLVHQQGHIDTQEAIDIVMEHITEKYIPKFKLGGAFMKKPEYDNLAVCVACNSNTDHGIFFVCEDGHVKYADSDKTHKVPERNENYEKACS